MAERTTGFNGTGIGSNDNRFGTGTTGSTSGMGMGSSGIQADPIRQVREQVEHLVEGIDIQSMTRQLEDFGRRNPVALALSAFTVGIAAGVLMRKRLPMS